MYSSHGGGSHCWGDNHGFCLFSWFGKGSPEKKVIFQALPLKSSEALNKCSLPFWTLFSSPIKWSNNTVDKKMLCRLVRLYKCSMLNLLPDIKPIEYLSKTLHISPKTYGTYLCAFRVWRDFRDCVLQSPISPSPKVVPKTVKRFSSWTQICIQFFRFFFPSFFANSHIKLS